MTPDIAAIAEPGLTWRDMLTKDEAAVLRLIEARRDESRKTVRECTIEINALLFRATMRLRRLRGEAP